MALNRAWATYVPTYRAREIQILAGWILAGESGAIVGLPGSGKSNLLGFLCHRPEALQPYLPSNELKLALVQVDLNNLPGSNLTTLYQVILRALFENRGQFAVREPSLATAIEMLYQNVQDKFHPFLLQSALREILLYLESEGMRLVLVLDPFDHLCQTASPQILDNLRGLRDSFKTLLSYIVGVRNELAHLRDPSEMGAIYDLLDIHLCWVGAMVNEDAHSIIAQTAAAAGRTVSKAEIKQLTELTGNYPSLLRSASQWLVRAAPVPKNEVWLNVLLSERSIQHRLEEIWGALDHTEQLALSELQKWESEVSEHKNADKIFNNLPKDQEEVLSRLADKGLCSHTGTMWHIRSDLFAAYISMVEGRVSSQIWLDENTDTIYKGKVPLEGFAPLERSVLDFLIANPGKRHTKTELIVGGWPKDLREYGVNDQSVYQVILELRKKIELNWTKPHHLITWRGNPEGGYQFFPEGRPG